MNAIHITPNGLEWLPLPDPIPQRPRAGILHTVGIDHTRLTYKYMGRYFRLTDVHGSVVKQVLA